MLKLHFHRHSMLAVVFICAFAASAFAQTKPADDHSLLQTGNTARLQRVFAKAKKGEPITVGVLGGSITQGFASSTPEHRYANLVASWWEKTFPESKITLVNAGIGATGSDYGCLRVQRDLLSKSPDFVIVEFSVNDNNQKHLAETYEGVVRQVLSAPNSPACLMLLMTQEDHTSAQEWHSKVGRHYQLPMISYKDAIFAKLDAGEFKWTDISPDDIHPNDKGHAMAAGFITEFLASQLAAAPETLPSIEPLPAPLFTDRYQKTYLVEGDALKPTSVKGWTYDEQGKSWNATEPGSVITFEAPGEELSLLYYRIHRDLGKVSVTVDDGAAQKYDGWFEKTWGGYRHTSQIASSLKPGMHTIRVELLEETSPQSKGHLFRIMGIGAAGVTE